MPENKSEWYHGYIFDKLIAPHQDHLFSIIESFIKDKSTVLDIGCGTGRMALEIAPNCKSVTGLDASLRNIKRAEKARDREGFKNIDFIHADALGLSEDKKYDYAVISFVLHELEEDIRAELLKKADKIADTVILADYIYPQRGFLAKTGNALIEMLAGRSHYKGYKSYNRNGGLDGIVKQAALQKTKEVKEPRISAHVVII